ncbi:hypothetical protein AVEN_181691-1 [Araneus ventricosus]|uniref:Uncharacterized protein n=1 Tax=Araneus ventricosus TaxID=182803 RepID=A0A4Y2MRW6_ARAVE|nr:hypothetical protein AVEN_181691-1 [Araneus ventricosus]
MYFVILHKTLRTSEQEEEFRKKSKSVNIGQLDRAALGKHPWEIVGRDPLISSWDINKETSPIYTEGRKSDEKKLTKVVCIKLAVNGTILRHAAAMECDRYGVSDRTATSFASAVLQDTAIVHEGEASHVVDRNKFRSQSKNL